MAIRKKKAVKRESKADIGEVLSEMQARFDDVENKLDALLSKTAALSRMVSTEPDPNFKTRATVSKKFPEIRDDRPRERKMYRAVCEDCKKDCEVPFMPKEGRPVYCKECHANRRRAANSRNIPDRSDIMEAITKTFHIEMPEATKAKTKTKTSAKPKAAKARKAAPKTTKAKAKKSKKTKPKASKIKKGKSKTRGKG